MENNLKKYSSIYELLGEIYTDSEDFDFDFNDIVYTEEYANDFKEFEKMLELF